MINQEDEHLVSQASDSGLPQWGVNVANYYLLFKSDQGVLRTHNTPKPNSFIFLPIAGNDEFPVFSRAITLEVVQKKLGRESQWNKLINRTMIWELWQNNDQDLVFYNPVQPVLRQVIVQNDFSRGQLLGDFEAEPEAPVLPKELEIVFYVNWLGLYGDLLLHAAAIRIGEDGYAFIGQSRAGKSTLARILSEDEDIKVIGEDQVVLRFINGEFWLFGSPWHFYSSLFAPDAVRLKGLFFLDGKGLKASLPLGPLEGVTRLMQTAFVPYYDPPAVERILNTLGQLSDSIPFLSFGFDLDEDTQKIKQRLVI